MAGDLGTETLLVIAGLEITVTAATSLGLTVALGLASWWATRRRSLEPGTWQTVAEIVVSVMEDAIGAAAPAHRKVLLPFIGSLWVFLVVANLAGLVPGLDSPTRDLSVTAALAIVVFFSVHWFGIRDLGLGQYLKHYLSPSPILLPFHLISEVTRTIALAIRLFGNMMSLEMAALLVLLVAGFLAPVPLLMLHVIEALVQAYIFGMLALIYIAGALQSQELRRRREE